MNKLYIIIIIVVIFILISLILYKIITPENYAPSRSNLYDKTNDIQISTCGKINPYCGPANPINGEYGSDRLCNITSAYDPITLGSKDCWANEYEDGIDPQMPLWPPQYEPCPEGSRDVAGTCNKICVDTQHWPGCGIVGPAGKPCDDGTYNCQSNCWTTHTERLCGITQSLVDRNKICPASHPSYAKGMGLCYRECRPGYHRVDMRCVPDGKDYLGTPCAGNCQKFKFWPWEDNYISNCDIGFSEVDGLCKPDEPDKYCKYKNGDNWFASNDGEKCIECNQNTVSVDCDRFQNCTCISSDFYRPSPPTSGFKNWFIDSVFVKLDPIFLQLDSESNFSIYKINDDATKIELTPTEVTWNNSILTYKKGEYDIELNFNNDEITSAKVNGVNVGAKMFLSSKTGPTFRPYGRLIWIFPPGDALILDENNNYFYANPMQDPILLTESEITRDGSYMSWKNSQSSLWYIFNDDELSTGRAPGKTNIYVGNPIIPELSPTKPPGNETKPDIPQGGPILGGYIYNGGPQIPCTGVTSWLLNDGTITDILKLDSDGIMYMNDIELTSGYSGWEQRDNGVIFMYKNWSIGMNYDILFYGNNIIWGINSWNNEHPELINTPITPSGSTIFRNPQDKVWKISKFKELHLKPDKQFVIYDLVYKPTEILVPDVVQWDGLGLYCWMRDDPNFSYIHVYYSFLFDGNTIISISGHFDRKKDLNTFPILPNPYSKC